MLWKTCLVLILAVQLSGCTLIGLSLDSRLCGDHDKDNNSRFSHNEAGSDEDECQFIFTSLGAIIDYSVFKSLTQGSSNSTHTSDSNSDPQYEDNEYSGASCPRGKKKICFLKEGCHCVNKA